MHAPRVCPPLGRLSRAALLLLIASWACGGSADSKLAPTTPTPKANVAAHILATFFPAATGFPRSEAGNYTVRVTNAANEPVHNVRVDFTVKSGRPGFVFSPADTAETDAEGNAHVAVTYSYLAGADRLLATVAGVAETAMVDVNVVHGWPDHVNIKPSGIHLFGAGDSATFQAVVVDSYQNPIPEVPLALQVSDTTLVSVTPPSTLLGNGTVRALKGAGAVTITSAASSNGMLSVNVFPNPRTVCAGVGPQDFVTSVPIAVTDSAICFAAAPQGSAYALMVYNESTDGATSLGTTVTGYNVVPQMLPPLSADRIRPSRSRSLVIRGASAPKLDLRFHERLLRRSRSMRGLFGAARAARSFGRAGSMGRIRGPSYALSASAPSVPAVDSLIALNVADGCTTADTRTFRVEAVGTHAIVLADTANPGGGFSRIDYQRFAARFDALIYPLDVTNFDAPTDIDGNDHVAILFTRAVNELTPPNAGAFIGGFFNPRDLFPRTQASPRLGLCSTSNEGEMFYMMVPDPWGAVNGNQFRLGFVDTLTTGTLAHEFQHLINASRRLYVNTTATEFEETWLDEGLSHTAEELLYFKESGRTPRTALKTDAIYTSEGQFDTWVADDANNFVRFYLYLLDPANHSPIDAGDDLETRGATWAFLRFAVDKSFSSDAGVWQRFANSTTTGFGTLTFALQRDPTPVLKDFALANMMGGHPSWNFIDVYKNVFVAAAYPLPYGDLQDGTPVPVTAKGGSASYWKFAIPPDAQAMLKFGSSAAPPDGNLKFVLVRTALGP